MNTKTMLKTCLGLIFALLLSGCMGSEPQRMSLAVSMPDVCKLPHTEMISGGSFTVTAVPSPLMPRGYIVQYEGPQPEFAVASKAAMEECAGWGLDCPVRVAARFFWNDGSTWAASLIEVKNGEINLAAVDDALGKDGLELVLENADDIIPRDFLEEFEYYVEFRPVKLVDAPVQIHVGKTHMMWGFETEYSFVPDSATSSGPHSC